MRSSGVKKWRRRDFDADRGPSGGNFASDAALVDAARLVVPLRRVANAYAPTTLICPDTFLTSTRAVLLTTFDTVSFWTEYLRMCLEVRQRETALSPRLNGR